MRSRGLHVTLRGTILRRARTCRPACTLSSVKRHFFLSGKIACGKNSTYVTARFILNLKENSKFHEFIFLLIQFLKGSVQEFHLSIN